ncbi:MAG TPA: AraC family transcriptional regulator [Tetragenococcus sp.]|nr:AraC family transcriptional regulator [Tetragenococcus sp.]
MSTDNHYQEFLAAKDYERKLAKLNFEYTIQSNNNAFIDSIVCQVDNNILTYSRVDCSEGVFSQKLPKTAYIALRFIKNGYEIHHFNKEKVILSNYSIGVFNLKQSSFYIRNQQTEGINLFVEKNPQNQFILENEAAAYVIDASSGVSRYLLDSLFSLVAQLKYCSTEASHFLLRQLIKNLFTYIKQIKQEDLDGKTINKAIEYIHCHFTDPALSLEEVAQNCQVSSRTLQKTFQKENLYFSKYVNELRLTQAAIMLFQTELPITFIAYQNGYSSSSYFTLKFKQKYTFTPKEYRLKNHKIFQQNKNEKAKNCPLINCFLTSQ